MMSWSDDWDMIVRLDALRKIHCVAILFAKICATVVGNMECTLYINFSPCRLTGLNGGQHCPVSLEYCPVYDLLPLSKHSIGWEGARNVAGVAAVLSSHVK